MASLIYSMPNCTWHLLRNLLVNEVRHQSVVQSLPNVHIPTGSLYVFSIYDFFVSSCIPIRGALPLIVSGVYALDIDDEIDLKIAQEIGNANEF